jgi:hypothetical protein
VAALSEVRDQAKELSPDDQKKLAQELLLLSQPQGDKGRTIIWILVLLILAGAIFVFGVMAYNLHTRDESIDSFVAFVSLALGAVAGPLAPSPVRKD